MSVKTTSMSFSDLMNNCTVISGNIKLNTAKVGRYGLELPVFTDQMDADVNQANALNLEQERLKSELKSKTDELNKLMANLENNYALAKKTVKMAEPQLNWVSYGITDKK